jgi:hypothetical protein
MPPVPPTPPKTPSPRTTKAALGRAYWAFHDKTTLRLRSNWLPWVDTEDLEAVEALAALRPSQPIAELHRQMLHDLTTENALVDEADQNASRQRYDEAVAIALPATQAYLRHAQTINTLTRNHSLAAGILDRGKCTGWIAWEPERSRSRGREGKPAIGSPVEH